MGRARHRRYISTSLSDLELTLLLSDAVSGYWILCMELVSAAESAPFSEDLARFCRLLWVAVSVLFHFGIGIDLADFWSKFRLF